MTVAVEIYDEDDFGLNQANPPAPPALVPLTVQEIGNLKHWEGVVDTHMRGAELAWGALLEIYEANLWREWPSWAEYVRARFPRLAKISNSRAYARLEEERVIRRIEQAQSSMEESERVAPATGRAARALAAAPEDQQGQLYVEKAKELGRAPTGRELEQEIAQRFKADPTSADESGHTAAFMDDFRAKRAAREGTPTLELGGRTAMGPPGTAKDPEKKKSHNERYTPSKYVEAERRVMGGIDIDPYSCERANRTVRATMFWDKETDGRRMPWEGRAHMNPPYKPDDYNEGAAEAVDLLIAKFDAGETTQAFAVMNSIPDAKWHQKLARRFPVCNTDHRIDYEDGTLPEDEQERGSPANGTSFFYLGPNVASFLREFEGFGAVSGPPGTDWSR